MRWLVILLSLYNIDVVDFGFAADFEMVAVVDQSNGDFDIVVVVNLCTNVDFDMVVFGIDSTVDLNLDQDYPST